MNSRLRGNDEDALQSLTINHPCSEQSVAERRKKFAEDPLEALHLRTISVRERCLWGRSRTGIASWMPLGSTRFIWRI
jgi:hypothetical protein